MDIVTGREFVLAQAYLILILTALVWAVLWSRRSASVHAWCAVGLLGAGFQLLLAAGAYGYPLPRLLEFPLLATLGVGGLLPKAFALHWLEERPRRLGLRAMLTVMAMNALIAAAFALSPASRMLLSFYVAFVLQVAAIGTMVYAIRLTRRHQLLNSGLLVGTIALALIPSLAAFAFQVVSGMDILVVPPGAVSLTGMAVVAFLTVCNNGLFIGVVTDLAARRETAISAELQRLKEQRVRLEERNRLMADLHDGLGSQLAIARLSADRGGMDSEKLKQLLDECLADLHLVVDTLNNNDGNLGDALRFLRHRIQGRLSAAHPEVHWDIDIDTAPALDGALILQLLRILQEALANALRHAAARNIHVGASYDAGRLHLSVRDDGRGFTAEAREGQGLQNMHRRARRLGARLQVTGSPAGTRVEVEVPVARDGALSAG